MANYPTSLPDIATVTRASDASDGSPTEPVAIVNEIAGEVEAIATELGLSPSGAEATVVARLDALDTTVSGKQPLDSDLTAIAALTTTSHGRSLLTGADAAASRSTIGAAATSHTHVAADVTDFAETARDTIATALTAGSGITITPNDGADTITIAASGSSGASAFFTAYAGDFATASGGGGFALSNPALTSPPTGNLNLATATIYFVRFRAATASTPNNLAFFVGTIGGGTGQTVEAGIYSATGTRVAVGNVTTFGDLTNDSIAFAGLTSTATLTAGTDYYYALRVSYTTGTTQAAALIPTTTDFAGLFTDASGYLLAFSKSATMDSSLSFTTGVTALNSFPWICGATV